MDTCERDIYQSSDYSRTQLEILQREAAVLIIYNFLIWNSDDFLTRLSNPNATKLEFSVGTL